MRILVVADHAPPLLGGSSTWLLQLLRALRSRHQVGLLISEGRDLAALDRAGVAPVFTVPTLAAAGPGEWARRAAELAGFARRQEVELIHLAGVGLAPLAPGLADAGLPTVLTLLGADLPVAAADDGAGELAAALARVTRLTAVSRAAAAQAAGLGFAGPVRVLPPGIDLDRFRPGDRGDARRALEIPPDRPLLLGVGRLQLAKGPLEALAALRLLADLDPLLVLVGTGPDRERIEARARFLGLEERVWLPGPVEEDRLLHLYQAADVALLPARDEPAAGLGLAAIEAAACALPVVGTRVGALAEVVQDRRTGTLVPARDAPALAAALRSLLADPRRAAELGGQARRLAEKAFGLETLAEQLAAVYQEAAGGEPAAVAQPGRRPPGRPRLPRPEPRVAVILPTWRCRRWLPRAIEGVLGQTWPAVDLYVADDASGDVDRELEERFPTVTFLTLRDQGGPYRIHNLVLSLTDSEIVAFHDADDWSRPDRLATQVEYLLERGFDGCGSWCRFVDVNGDPVGFRTLPPYVSLALRERLDTFFLNPAALYRREVFDRLLGFDSQTRFGADTELIFRAAFTFDLGNVQRFLYHATTRPDALSRSAETGFNSPARITYRERVWTAAEAVRTGAAPAPPPGLSLMGEPIRSVSPDLVLRLRPGRGNRTLKERP